MLAPLPRAALIPTRSGHFPQFFGSSAYSRWKKTGRESLIIGETADGVRMRKRKRERLHGYVVVRDRVDGGE